MPNRPTPLITHRLPLALAAALCSTAAHAGTYAWNASSGLMPDQVGAGLVLGSDSTLTPTMAAGLMTIASTASPDMSYYVQTGADIIMPTHLTIVADLRVVSDASSYANRAAAAISFTTLPSVGTDIFFGNNEVFWVDSSGSRGATASVSTADRIHHYSIDVSSLTAGSAFTVSQDGTVILTGNVPGPGGAGGGWGVPTIWFGDGTVGASGETQWQSFSHNAAAVPEPASWALMLAGLAGLGMLARHRHPARRTD